jgi:hypothetical protein
MELTMKSDDEKTSRRSFFLKGSAVLGAGVTAASGASAKPVNAATGEQDREAIRRLHLAFIAGVEDRASEAALSTHQAYRSNALQERDSLEFSESGLEAVATWNVDVKVSSPLEGDSTIAQMARFQGMLADVHWESGRLQARYVKARGKWQVAALDYLAS